MFFSTTFDTRHLQRTSGSHILEFDVDFSKSNNFRLSFTHLEHLIHVVSGVTQNNYTIDNTFRTIHRVINFTDNTTIFLGTIPLVYTTHFLAHTGLPSNERTNILINFEANKSLNTLILEREPVETTTSISNSRPILLNVYSE